jgi:hypothetical protein
MSRMSELLTASFYAPADDCQTKTDNSRIFSASLPISSSSSDSSTPSLQFPYPNFPKRAFLLFSPPTCESYRPTLPRPRSSPSTPDLCRPKKASKPMRITYTPNTYQHPTTHKADKLQKDQIVEGPCSSLGKLVDWTCPARHEE